MSDSYRDRLVASRPEADEYRELMEALPHDVAGLEGRISGLKIFPVKALGGLAVDRAIITPTGLSDVSGRFGDRMAMPVYPNTGKHDGQPYSHMRYSQREEGGLVLMRPELVSDGLRYAVDGIADDLIIQAHELNPREGERVHVKMGKDGDVQSGVLENGRITEWLRKTLRKIAPDSKVNTDEVGLLLPDPAFKRPVDAAGRTNEESSTLYSDGGQLLVANQATLDWMNRSLQAEYGKDFDPMEMDAFRPNIVLDGLPANAEDVIARLKFLSLTAPEILFAMLCVRCPVTRVIQATGESRKAEPLAWLSKNRPKRVESPKNSATFAVNAAFSSKDTSKIVAVGDRFKVIAEKV